MDQYRDCHPSTQIKDDSIAFNPSLHYSITSPLFCGQSVPLITALAHFYFVVSEFCYSITSPLFCCQSLLFPRLTCMQGPLDKQSVDSSDSSWKDRYQHWLRVQKTQRHPRLQQILLRHGYVRLFCLACLSLCLCLLSKWRYIVDIDTRRLLFSAHIKPHIDYASSHLGQM